MDLAPTYTDHDFARLIHREHERVELKTGVGAKAVQETMVAFSNTSGGVIFIGVSDDRRVVGRALDQGTDDDIHRTARAAYDLGRFTVQQIEVAGRPVVAVHVRPREEGFAQTHDSRVLVRRGSSNVGLLGGELRAFVMQRSLARFESSDSGVALSSVPPEQVTALLGACGWSGEESDRLREHGLLTTAGTLTVCGALVLTDPTGTLAAPKLVIDVTGYESDTSPDYVRREQISGPVPKQVEAATATVMRDIGVDLVVTGPRRQQIPRLPLRAVREVVANAVAHRTYELGTSSVSIEVRPSRVVVTSPGRLPEGVTTENLREANAPRNPDLITVLRHLDLAEDRGRGIDLIQDRMREDFLPDPVFEEPGNQVRVSMPTGRLITAEERGWVLHVQREHGLSDDEVLLLVHAVRHGRLTNASARAAVGSDSVTARGMLRRLRDLGLLDQHGQRGGASYEVGLLEPKRSDAEIVQDLARRSPVTNMQVRQTLGITRQQALSLLTRLTDGGALVRQGHRRAARYVLADDERNA